MYVVSVQTGHPTVYIVLIGKLGSWARSILDDMLVVRLKVMCVLVWH